MDKLARTRQVDSAPRWALGRRSALGAIKLALAASTVFVANRGRWSLVGYLVAVLGQVAAISLTLYLRAMWPHGFPYQGVLAVVVVIAVALRWDFGPSLLATLVGAEDTKPP